MDKRPTQVVALILTAALLIDANTTLAASAICRGQTSWAIKNPILAADVLEVKSLFAQEAFALVASHYEHPSLSRAPIEEAAREVAASRTSPPQNPTRRDFAFSIGALAALGAALFARMGRGIMLIKPRNPDAPSKPSGIRRAFGPSLGIHISQELSVKQKLIQKLSVRLGQKVQLK